MEILSSAESFSLETLTFIYTILLLHQPGDTSGNYWIAKTSQRKAALRSTIARDALVEDPVALPREAYQPIPPRDCIIAHTLEENSDSTTVPNSYYVKKPNLLSLPASAGDDTTQIILRELLVCEAIHRHPHPSIAKYYGCLVSRGRVAGLCFEKYPANLMSRLNPGHLNKTMFLESADRLAARREAARYLPGIKAAINHLHSLGLAHNDINPANIMITADEVPVLIDFDSCLPFHEPMNESLKRTYGWYDPEVQVSEATNDLRAVSELEVWLLGASADEYQFSG